MCKARCCPGDSFHIPIAVAVVVPVLLFWRVALEVFHVAEVVGLVVTLVLAVLAITSCAVAVTRFIRAAPAARRNYPKTILARLRWRWLARNLGLAQADPHGRNKIRGAFGPSIGSNVRIEKPKGHVRYPRARFRADDFGLVARVKTIPGVGRAEFEDAAVHLADEWRVDRVQVSQRAPGRLIVRGLRTDPLSVPYGMLDAPPGTYDRPDITRPYLGLSEWAEHRHLSLPGQTGIVIGGLPGRGKTSLTASLLCQWSGTAAVQLALLDGKGSADHDDWRPRAWLHSDDDLDSALAVLEDCHALMRSRLGCVVEATGQKNSWHAGPSGSWPMIVVLIDECQTYLDVASYKGDKEREAKARRCVALVAELIRKGRSAMFVTILATQKASSDSIPTALRDNCGISLAFAVKTVDAAIAVLGADIREYASVSPVGLRDDAYVGVLTSTLPTGLDPFTRVRVPEITEDAAAERAFATAHFRRDPSIQAMPEPAAGLPAVNLPVGSDV